MSALDRALSGATADSAEAVDEGYAVAWRELDQALAAHPTRFLGFASVPLGRSAAETAATVHRQVVTRGLHGIGELTPPPARRP